ncbi:short-chain dehydrogenase [Streptomyces sp. CS113]|uniref:SDR family oxidoreductase n=1 Tax=Streptomyces sp. CS113 TaxID=1982761 RepID=UPI000B41311D|nr:SDR family oxidoreductase [Streptomyces sp. CS113]OWA00777.1 short-chain dehydrogenase [Streptomyces sp. CS113]
MSTTSRVHVVTGAASGIGAATRQTLLAQGDRVIGVDLRGSDIDCDLSDPAAREGLADRVAAQAPDGIDAVHAIAGVSLPHPLTVKVNYFGATATLTALRPLLAHSAAPRAVVVTSFSALQETDPELLDALRDDDEKRAVSRAEALTADERGHLIYPSSKRAIAEWVRTQAITDAWAGAGIPLNAVGPGIIRTPMTAPLLATEEGRDSLYAQVPSPLNGAAEPENIADLLAWLTGPTNRHVTGQVVFADSGADATVRGPRIFG